MYLKGEMYEKEQPNEKILFTSYNCIIINCKFIMRSNINWNFYEYTYRYKAEYFSRLFHKIDSQKDEGYFLIQNQEQGTYVALLSEQGYILQEQHLTENTMRFVIPLIIYIF